MTEGVGFLHKLADFRTRSDSGMNILYMCIEKWSHVRRDGNNLPKGPHCTGSAKLLSSSTILVGVSPTYCVSPASWLIAEPITHAAGSAGAKMRHLHVKPYQEGPFLLSSPLARTNTCRCRHRMLWRYRPTSKSSTRPSAGALG